MERCWQCEGNAVVSFTDAAALIEAREVFRAEASQIEACFGKNAYSDFLNQHGHRPDPKQAATIGRLLGMRVQASDGSMQPPLTKGERDTLQTARNQLREKARYRRQVDGIRQAILSLAQNVDSPEDVLRYVHSRFDAPIIREHLSHAVEWLSRFAEEWDRRDKCLDEKVPQPLEGDGP
jgi:hypothetical protein